MLHLVPLPGKEPGLSSGFAMILELDKNETEIDAPGVAEWKLFAGDLGARGLFITNRNLVILSHYEGPKIVPGPCPSYMEGLGIAYTCDLRANHDGLHEGVHLPTVEGMPPNKATWGDRVPWRPEHDKEVAEGWETTALTAALIEANKLLVDHGHEPVVVSPSGLRPTS